jgi:hypothetical protein
VIRGRIGSTDASSQTNPSSSGWSTNIRHMRTDGGTKKGLTPEPKMSGVEEGGPWDRGFHVDDEHRVTVTTRQRIESTELL